MLLILKAEHLIITLTNPSDPGSLTDNRIYSIVQDKYDNIWIGTYAGGLNKLERKTGKIMQLPIQ